MSKPSDQVSAASSSQDRPARQHQSHPEETEEELREHQGLSSSSSSSSTTSVPETGPLRGLVIKQEPPDPQEQEEREQRERQVEQDFLFRQVRMRGREEVKDSAGGSRRRIKNLKREGWKAGRGKNDTQKTGWEEKEEDG